MSESKPYIGGQAVLEGVMMRAPGCMTVAVRRPDGSLALKEDALPAADTASVRKWPFLRGMLTLVESMRLGYRALQFSAEQQMTAEEREKGAGMTGTAAMVLSVALAIGIFKALPQGLAYLGSRGLGLSVDPHGWGYQLAIGGAKLIVIVGYMLFVSRVPEMRRVFQYHGAEHKTIYAYEAGLPLTLDNVRAQSTLHPRCGTTFLVIVVAISIVVGMGAAIVLRLPSGLLGQLGLFVSSVALLPVIAGVAYEIQRFTARHCTTGPLRALLWPGFLFQKITTREPDDTQLEVAIVAMKSAAWREVAAGVPYPAEPRLFPSFAAFETALGGAAPSAAE